MNRVFKIFEEILAIPRSSGEEEQIANYIVNFAKEHNCDYKKDSYNNVFIRKNNNSHKTIILQAHSDMVCTSNIDYDFINKGIEFYIDGDYYKAKDTSLGADDGIGIAIILAMLEEKDMPNIEAMITTQEETTMLGASNFDYNLLTGKTLISLDGIKEADIEASSAGMCSITINKELLTEVSNDIKYKMNISGLMGGHSGDDIDKNRCNAIKLGFDIISKLNCTGLYYIDIGEKDNVIPNNGNIIFSSNLELNKINEILKRLKYNLSSYDNNLNLSVVQSKDHLRRIINYNEITNFVNELDDGLLETFEDKFPLLSSNIGKINMNNNEIIIKMSVRSSDENEEEKQLEKIRRICNKYNFVFNLDVKKPFFPYKEKSEIRKLLSNTYKELYNKDTITKKVHACMEAGIISSNIDGLDICTIAPTINNCHSINESISISSTNRVYNWLKETLIRYNVE